MHLDGNNHKIVISALKRVDNVFELLKYWTNNKIQFPVKLFITSSPQLHEYSILNFSSVERRKTIHNLFSSCADPESNSIFINSVNLVQKNLGSFLGIICHELAHLFINAKIRKLNRLWHNEAFCQYLQKRVNFAFDNPLHIIPSKNIRITSVNEYIQYSGNFPISWNEFEKRKIMNEIALGSIFSFLEEELTDEGMIILWDELIIRNGDIWESLMILTGLNQQQIERMWHTRFRMIYT